MSSVSPEYSGEWYFTDKSVGHDDVAVPPRRLRGAPGSPAPRHWLVLQLREAGYLTVSDVAKALGIGTTSLRRREGTLYPRAARIGGIRVYHEADVELLRRRDTVPPRVAGGTAGFGPWTRRLRGAWASCEASAGGDVPK